MFGGGVVGPGHPVCWGGEEEALTPPPPLPGPGYDLPVDLDGNGVSTYGEQYAFNHWLDKGGDIALALDSGTATGKVIDLSEFFSDPKSALTPDAQVAQGLPGGGGAQAAVTACTTAAVIGPTFQGMGQDPGDPTPVQVGCAYQGAKIHHSQGHCVITETLGNAIEGQVYIARDFNSGLGGGGISRIDVTSMAGGNIPIPDAWVTQFVTNKSFVRQVTWDRVFNRLLVTQGGTNHVLTVGLAFGSTTILVAGGLQEPFGITTLGPTVTCGDYGLPEDLLIAETLPLTQTPGRLKKYGRASCPNGFIFLWNIFEDATAGLNLLKGMVFHNPAPGTIDSILPGAYVVESGGNRVLRFQGDESWFPVELKYTLATGFTQARNIALLGSTLHTIPGLNKVENRHLYVGEERASGHIWRVKHNGAKAILATGLNSCAGITAHPSGVLLASEQSETQIEGRLVVIDGFRYKFNRGDANNDGRVNSSDPSFILNWLFSSGPRPQCLDAADVNDSGFVNMEDATDLLDFLFSSAPPPADPFYGTWLDAGCGWDPTIDLLGCRLFATNNCEVSP